MKNVYSDGMFCRSAHAPSCDGFGLGSAETFSYLPAEQLLGATALGSTAAQLLPRRLQLLPQDSHFLLGHHLHSEGLDATGDLPLDGKKLINIKIFFVSRVSLFVQVSSFLSR